MAAVNGGFVLLRPATVAKRPAVDVYVRRTAWPGPSRPPSPARPGFTGQLVNGGPDGAVITGQTGAAGAGGRVADRVRLGGRQDLAAGPPVRHGRRPRTVSGVALAQDGTVVTAGISPGPDSRQPVLVLARHRRRPRAGGHRRRSRAPSSRSWPSTPSPRRAARRSRWAAPTAIPPCGPRPTAAARGPRHRARPGGARPAGDAAADQRGPRPEGWLAVGGVTASAPEHPVVLVSANGRQLAGGRRRAGLRRPGLFTEAGRRGHQRGLVIVGYQTDQAGAGRAGHRRPAPSPRPGGRPA